MPDASSPSPNLNIPSDAEGDPPLIDCANVFDLLEQAAAQSPGHVYCRQGEECVSRRELLGRVLTFADRLAAAGFQPGDRVAVMLENSIDYIVLVFAMAKMSLTWVPINTRLRGAGLAHILRHSEPRCLIADRALAPVITAASQGEPQCMILWQEEGKSLLAESAEPHVPPAAAGTLPLGRHVFSISYTSGTTGWAKGVIVTHKMMAAASQAVLHLADVRDSDRMVMWEPLYHIGGSQLLLLPLLRLSTLTLAGKFSSKNFLSLLREAQATQLHYLGGVLQLMLKQPQSAKDKNHALRIAWGGGAPSNIWRAFEERFGVTLRECYGMTETSSIVTCNIEGVVGSIGRPLSWFSVSIVKQDGTRAQPRERGEIVVRQRVPGLLFEGYYKDEGTTRKALRGDALHTGDLGSMDEDGYLYFHGRMGDSVRTKGENVSAFEVEHVVSSHADVEECAMIGVPGEQGENDIKIFIRSLSGKKPDFASLVEWCTPRMASFQIPRYFAHVEAFEKTPSERIKKHALSPSTDDCWDRLKRQPAE